MDFSSASLMGEVHTREAKLLEDIQLKAEVRLLGEINSYEKYNLQEKFDSKG